MPHPSPSRTASANTVPEPALDEGRAGAGAVAHAPQRSHRATWHRIGGGGYGGGAGAITQQLGGARLGGAAQLLAPVLRRPTVARLLEAFVGVVMTATALRTLPL